MSFVASFRSIPLLAYQQISDAIKASDGFFDFTPGDADGILRGNLERTKAKRLPNFHLAEIEFDDVTISGTLSADTSVSVLRDIFLEGASDIGRIGDFCCTVCLDLKGFSDAPTRRAHVGIRRDNGVFIMTYSGEWFVYKTVEHFRSLRGQFETIVRIARLPVAIIDSGDLFRLEPVGARHFAAPLGGSFGAEAPTYFNCETDDEVPAQLFARLERALNEMACMPLYKMQWSISRSALRDIQGIRPDPDKAFELYRLAMAKGWPAAEYFYSYSFRLKNLRAIETIRENLETRDVFAMPVCAFRAAPELDTAVMKVLTSKKGHRLELEVQEEQTSQIVSQRLGIEFKFHSEL